MRTDASRVVVFGPPRWRAAAGLAVVAAAVAMWVFAFGGHSVLRSQVPAPHPAHALIGSLGSQFAVNVDHPHVSKGSPTVDHHEAFAVGVLPNGPAAIAALGVVVAVAAGASPGWQQNMLAGRGPPRGLRAALTGQDLLMRFCLSRR